MESRWVSEIWAAVLSAMVLKEWRLPKARSFGVAFTICWTSSTVLGVSRLSVWKVRFPAQLVRGAGVSPAAKRERRVLVRNAPEVFKNSLLFIGLNLFQSLKLWQSPIEPLCFQALP